MSSERLEAAISRHHGLLNVAFGVVATFYGRNLTYFILLSRVDATPQTHSSKHQATAPSWQQAADPLCSPRARHQVFLTAEGLPAITPAVRGLCEKIRRVRVAIADELRKPEVQEARGAAAQAVRRVASVQQAYADAQLDQDAAASERLASELAEVRLAHVTLAPH